MIDFILISTFSSSLLPPHLHALPPHLHVLISTFFSYPISPHLHFLHIFIFSSSPLSPHLNSLPPHLHFLLVSTFSPAPLPLIPLSNHNQINPSSTSFSTYLHTFFTCKSSLVIHPPPFIPKFIPSPIPPSLTPIPPLPLTPPLTPPPAPPPPHAINALVPIPSLFLSSYHRSSFFRSFVLWSSHFFIPFSSVLISLRFFHPSLHASSLSSFTHPRVSSFSTFLLFYSSLL